jgi:glycopeptide antibiotics resistance protein
MRKRLISIVILIAYSALLIKLMVFKDVPLIGIGSLMLNFGGTQAGHANFVPFKTILPYVLGDKGWIIAGINLVGNISLLIPIGFLVPFVWKNMTWRKSLALAVGTGLVIEILQVVLRVGIFDIDDVILNALGVMIGYWSFIILAKIVHSMKPKNIVIAALIVIVVVFCGVAAFQNSPMRISFGGTGPDRGDNGKVEIPSGGDLCGGTGGAGQIVSTGGNSIIIKRKDGSNQTVNLADQAAINTSNGPGSKSDLKIGDRITIVGGPNPDGSFIAEAVFVCS